MIDEDCLDTLRTISNSARTELNDSIKNAEQEYQEAMKSLKGINTIEFITLAKDEILLRDCISIGNTLMDKYRKLKQKYHNIAIFGNCTKVERTYANLCIVSVPEKAITYLTEMIRLCELKADLLCMMDMYHSCYRDGVQIIIKHNNK